MHPVPMLSRAISVPLLMASLTSAAEIPKATAILQEHCLKCHNTAAKMSGLSLASRADATKGGLHGPAIARESPTTAFSCA